MTLLSTEAVMQALRARALPALPTTRVWENEAAKPSATTTYVQEALVPNGGAQRSLVAGGVVEDDFLYLLTYVGVAGTGTAAINTTLDGILARFIPGSSVTATDGTIVRVRRNPKPYRGQITSPTATPNRAVAVVTIPVRCITITT